MDSPSKLGQDRGVRERIHKISSFLKFLTICPSVSPYVGNKFVEINKNRRNSMEIDENYAIKSRGHVVGLIFSNCHSRTSTSRECPFLHSALI